MDPMHRENPRQYSVENHRSVLEMYDSPHVTEKIMSVLIFIFLGKKKKERWTLGVLSCIVWEHRAQGLDNCCDHVLV